MDIAGQPHIAGDAAEVARSVARFVAGRIARARGPFRLVLSGGSTPRAAYEMLARESAIEWSCVELFFGDERFVPPDDRDSNYRMVHESLLAGGNIHPRGLYGIPTDGDPESAAQRYEEMLRQQYGASVLGPGRPLFDLVLLGLGPDGHTASLLPGQPVLEERTRWVAPVPLGRKQPRITLTYPALESSHAIAFVVEGAAKADVVRRVRAGDRALPAGRLAPQGAVHWFLDSAAAGFSHGKTTVQPAKGE